MANFFFFAKAKPGGGATGTRRAAPPPPPPPAELRRQAAQQTAMWVGPQLIDALQQLTAVSIRQREKPALEKTIKNLILLLAQKRGELNHHRERLGLQPKTYPEYNHQPGIEPEYAAPLSTTTTGQVPADQWVQDAADEDKKADFAESEIGFEKVVEAGAKPGPQDAEDGYGYGEEYREDEDIPALTAATATTPEPVMVYRPYYNAPVLEDTTIRATSTPQPQPLAPLAGTGTRTETGLGAGTSWPGPGLTGFAPPPNLTTFTPIPVGSPLPTSAPPTATTTTMATGATASWLTQATTPNLTPTYAPTSMGPLPPPPQIQPPPSLANRAATPLPYPTSTQHGATAKATGTGMGPVAALLIATAFLILSLFGGTVAAPLAQAQTGPGYQLAVQVTIQPPARAAGSYKMQLERDGQPLLAVPVQAQAQPGVLRAVFIAGPGQTQASLIIRDDQGAIIARKTEDWSSLPPGGYSFEEILSLSLAGATAGAGAGNAEDTVGRFLPQSGPVQAGLPGWASTALTSAGIAPLTQSQNQSQGQAAQTQTQTGLTPAAGAGASNKAASDQASQPQAQQMVMVHRNSPIPAFLGSLVMFGLAALLLIHLSQTGALPALVAGWTSPRQPQRSSNQRQQALVTATAAQNGAEAAILSNNTATFAPTPTFTPMPTTTLSTLDPDEPEPAEDEAEAEEENEAKIGPKAKKGFGFGLGRSKTSRKQIAPTPGQAATIFPANNEVPDYAPVPPPDPTGAVVAGGLNLAGLGEQDKDEEDDDNQNPFEDGAARLAPTYTQNQPDSADLATISTAPATNPTQTDWEFSLDLNGLGAATQGSPGLASDGAVASLVIPRKLAASTLGASESRAQEQVAHYIEQKGAALLQAEQVRVNLEYALRSAARLLRVEREYHTLENRYADNGAALDILVEVERSFMLPGGGSKKAGAAANKPTTIKKFVAVEVDGPHHQLPGRERRDRLKNAFLEKAGVVLVRVRPGEFAKLESDLAYIGGLLWLDELKKSGQLTGQEQAHSQGSAVRLSRADQGFTDEPANSNNKSWFIFAGGNGGKGGRGRGQSRQTRGKGRKRS